MVYEGTAMMWKDYLYRITWTEILDSHINMEMILPHDLVSYYSFSYVQHQPSLCIMFQFKVLLDFIVA